MFRVGIACLSSPLGVLSSLTPSRNWMQHTNKQQRLRDMVRVLMATATWYKARCSSGLFALLGPVLATRWRKNSARKAMSSESRHSSAREPRSWCTATLGAEESWSRRLASATSSGVPPAAECLLRELTFSTS